MKQRGHWWGGVLSVLLAVACSSSSSSSGQGGGGGQTTGAAAAGGGAAGRGQGGATAGARGSSAGAGGTTTGGASGSPSGAGGSTSEGTSGGASGTPSGGSAGTGAGGTGQTTGGASGMSGTPTGGATGSACAATALTNCTGTTIGAWCVDTFFAGNPSAPSFTNIWSDGPTDAWVVGAGFNPATGTNDGNGIAIHWDGCAWTPASLATTAGLLDVWGAAANDVWAVGASGTALHWNGSAWSSTSTGTTVDLASVSGTASNDVWALGVGTSLHWNGSVWSTVPGFPPNSTVDVFDGDIWAVAPNDVWVALGLPDGLAHFDGTGWTQIATAFPGFGFFGIWASGTTGWAVGEGRQIMQLSGGTWTLVQPPDGSSEGFLNVMGLGADVWIAGQATDDSLGGGAFQPVTDVPAGTYSGLWLTPSQIWLAGDDFASGAAVRHRAR